MGNPRPADRASHLSIGAAAKAAGTTARAIRFYEAQGLMPRPQRDRGNRYRRYAAGDIHRLRSIRRAQDLGFSLAEIGDLLVLDDGSQTDCAAVRDVADKHLRVVSERIADLVRVQQALQGVITSCSTTPARTRGCPLMDALAAPTDSPSSWKTQLRRICGVA